MLRPGLRTSNRAAETFTYQFAAPVHSHRCGRSPCQTDNQRGDDKKRNCRGDREPVQD